MICRGLSAEQAGPSPWFRVRPGLALAVAGALYVLVFALRMARGADAADATNMLYTLPIALVAIGFGRLAGLVAGILGIALTGLWTVLLHVDLTGYGWASRALPMVLLGLLVGDASGRIRAGEMYRRSLEGAAQRHRDAVEINDTLVQGMAAVKWSLEAGRVEAALAQLNDTLETGHALVSDLMREAGMGLNGHRPRPRQRDRSPGKIDA